MAFKVWARKPDRKVIQRRGWKKIGSSYIRTDNPRDVAEVELRKRLEGKDVDDIFKNLADPTYEPDKIDVADAMMQLAAELEPDLSPEAALLKHWKNPAMSSLYALHDQVDQPEPAEPVAKGDDQPPVWREIERRAQEMRETDVALTKEQAIARALETDPALYAAYRAQADAAFSDND